MLNKSVLAAAALLVLAGAANANLVLDGSFEAVQIDSPGWGSFPGTSMPGWTATGGALEVRSDLVGSAQDGANFVELDSDANMSISQVIDTIAGQTYTLSFWYSNRPTDPVYNSQWPNDVVPAESNGLLLDLGNGAFSVYTPAANTTSDNQWQEYTTTFVATGPTTLTFSATGWSDSYGTSLDNIVVTGVVPEPAQLSLMVAGLLMAGGIARRVRKG